MRLRLRLLLTSYQYQPVEFALGLLASVWGAWILMPWDTFGSTAIYRMIGGAEMEPLWGLVFLEVGALSIWGLIRRRLNVRLWCSRLIGAGWGILAVAAGFGNWQSTAMPMDSVFCLLAIWVQLRLSVWYERTQNGEMGNGK